MSVRPTEGAQFIQTESVLPFDSQVLVSHVKRRVLGMAFGRVGVIAVLGFFMLDDRT